MIESSVPTSKHQELQSIVAGALSSHQDAFRWWEQFVNFVLTLDHIVDEDELDRPMAEKVMIAMVLDWPFNPFFEKYKFILTTVFVNAYDSWRFSNRPRAPKEKAYDVYTEMICTLLYLTGGLTAVDKYMPKIRELTMVICEEDDIKDGGKK